MTGQPGKADNDKFQMDGQKRQDCHHRTVIREARTATDSQTGHDTVPRKRKLSQDIHERTVTEGRLRQDNDDKADTTGQLHDRTAKSWKQRQYIKRLLR